MIKAIETVYNGYRFRSRLEARWAVFFDALGVKYEYEKEGFDLGDAGRYLPDFFIPDFDIFAEVKGKECTTDEWIKIDALKDQSGKDVVVLRDIPSTDENITLENYEWRGFQRKIYLDDKQYPKLRDEDNGVSGWGLQVFCPICGYEYVHIGQIEKLECDDYSAWSGRGCAARVQMWCEDGCAWTFRFGFHKGYTFFKIENASVLDLDFALMLARLDMQKRDSALLAARQARFEHGETPRI